MKEIPRSCTPIAAFIPLNPLIKCYNRFLYSLTNSAQERS
jgi:hypothetical protein